MHEQLRSLLFALWFVILLSWELFFPFLDHSSGKLAQRKIRWVSNFLIIATGQIAIRSLIAAGILIFAQTQLSNGVGLFNWLRLNEGFPPLVLAVHLIILDLIIYFQHVLSHKIPFLWRLHQIHHAEDFLDVSSALRFHPLEIFLSYLYKIVWILLLGIPLESLFIFEILLSSMAMFNHANIAIPHKLEKVLRLLIVTPQFHRTHHYADAKYMNHNFGFNLSCWDYLFRTYADEKLGAFANEDIGLPSHPNKPHRFLWLMKLPFLKSL